MSSAQPSELITPKRLHLKGAQQSESQSLHELSQHRQASFPLAATHVTDLASTCDHCLTVKLACCGKVILLKLIATQHNSLPAHAAGLVMATKAKIPPEVLAIYPPKFLVSRRLVSKRVVIGRVPERLMPFYIPCKRAVSAANKFAQKHWWKVLVALAVIASVAYLFKQDLQAATDKRPHGRGTFPEAKPPTTPPPPLLFK